MENIVYDHWLEANQRIESTTDVANAHPWEHLNLFQNPLLRVYDCQQPKVVGQPRLLMETSLSAYIDRATDHTSEHQVQKPRRFRKAPLSRTFTWWEALGDTSWNSLLHVLLRTDEAKRSSAPGRPHLLMRTSAPHCSAARTDRSCASVWGSSFRSVSL